MRHGIYDRASLPPLKGVPRSLRDLDTRRVEGHDCMDAGGRATQESKAEDEGINKIEALAFQIPSP
jgi:hypothetical protein